MPCRCSDWFSSSMPRRTKVSPKTLEESCGALRSDSPNLGASSSAVQPFALGSLAHDELQRLMRRLCAAVDSAA